MAANPFYVQPAVAGRNFQQGLSGLGQVLEEQQAAKQKQQDTEEMLNLFRSGQPGQVAEFMIRKPELAQQLQSTIGWRDAQTQQNAYDTFKRIEQGADPVAALSERLMFLEQAGADPTDTIEELQEAMDNPEQYVQTVSKKREAFFPQQYLQDLKIEAEKRKLTAQPEGEKFTGSYGNLALAMFGTNDSSRMTTQMLQQLDEEARRRQLERPPSTTVNINPEQKQFSNEQDLRKEVKADPTIKNFKDVQFAYDQVSTALKKPSAANDLTAATKFMKILDPGSVVRESELGLAMEATGKLDLAMNYFNRLQTGEKLTPSQRQDFLQAATALYEAASSRAKPVIQQYSQIARDSGLNADRVIDKDLQSILRNPAMAKLPSALQNFSESDFAEAAAQAGVSVDEFINIMSR